MTQKRSARSIVTAIITACLFALLASCGGGGGDSGSVAGATGSITIQYKAPDGSLYSPPIPAIPANGSSSVIIHALITDSAGNPVRHYTDVTFSTNLGYFRNFSTTYTMQTQPPLNDKGWPDTGAAPTGIAEIAFMAGNTPGVATVTVRSNNVSQSVYITISGSSAGIQLSAEPASIPADGQSATVITARITDSSGSPATPGTPVTFKTGLGYFKGNLKSYTVYTPDSTGIVQVAMEAGVVPGTTYVEASSNNVAQALSIVLTKTDPQYADITVDANPSRIPADGASQSLITATVTRIRTVGNEKVAAAGLPISGVPVTFYKITSNVEPEPLPDANTYTGSGTSIAGPFYSYGGVTKFQMTAEPGLQPYFTVWIFNPLSNEREQLYSTSTFPVDTYKDPVTGVVTFVYRTLIQEEERSLQPGNYQLEIQTNCSYEIKIIGDIGPAQTGKTVLGFAKTDANGNAFYTYTADWLTGTFNIRAETGELSNSENALTEETAITQTSGIPAPIAVKAGSDSIYANGEDSTSITAQVWTQAGNKVPDGTEVHFGATSGTFDPQTGTAVTVDGRASIKLISIASADSVNCTVVATVGTDSGATSLTFLGVSLLDMQAAPATIFANGEDESTISVRIRDANGLAVPNESVIFETDAGSIKTKTATTNSQGIATTTLIASTTAETATVTATYGKLTASAQVVFTGSVPVGTITLTASPTSIPADGNSSSIVTAAIRDTAGKAVPKGTSVTFATNLGTFSNGTQSYTVITPDANGVVSVALIAGTTAGTATVTALSNSVTQSITIEFTGSGVAAITLTATPSTLPADGASTSDIRASVTDAQGNPIKDGEVISFAIISGTGTLSSASAGTSAGIATVTYTAGTAQGDVVIRAMSSNNVTTTVTVTLTGGGGVAAIALTATPSTLVANGTSTSEIRASVTDAQGNPIADGEAISFAITSGSGTLSSASATTSAGIATVTYTAGTIEGSVVIRAMSANNVSNTVTVTLTSGAGTPASLSLAVSQTSVKSDNSDFSTVTATVLDANNAALEGVVVSFSANAGQLSGSSAQTNANGQATVTFSSGTTDRSNQTATITATVIGLTPQMVPIQITGSTLVITAGTTNLTAGGATTTVTVTAKDAGGNLVFNAPITFSTSGPQVSVSPLSGNTGVNGQFTATVTPVSDGTVTVTAVWSSDPQASQAFTVGTTGNVFEILLPATSPFSAKTRTVGTLVTTSGAITFHDNGAAADTITSAGLFGAYAAGDKIMVGGSTSNDGVYTLSSTVAPTANTLTLVATDSLTNEGPTANVVVTNGVLVRVRAPSPIANVVFATSIGVWDGGGSPIVTKAVASGYAFAVLTSTLAGSATVQVYDAANSATTAETIVAFSVPSGDAAQITLQSNVYMVARSTGGVINTATLTATVRTSLAAGSQVVSGAVVAFSIENPTGGGETVSPVVTITDGAGQAKSTFTSGSLSSGSQGVVVRAVVDLSVPIVANNTIAFVNSNPDTITRADGGSFIADGFVAGDQISVKGSTNNDGYYTIATGGVAAGTLTLVNADSLTAEGAGASVTISRVITDTVSIIIGGTAASVVIGRGTVIYDVNDATYRLPMSALVTDSNGNAVSGAVVTLSAWPLQYAPGVWYDQDPDPNSEWWVIYYTGAFIDNEDANENLILDPGEDKDGDGQLTPASSSAGGVPVPAEVTTGANGVAAFDLVYLKANAEWIKTRVRAKTYVVGTETTSSVTMVLPAERGQARQGLLPDSPFPIGLVTSTALAVNYTFPTFRGAGDTFTSSANLLAGTSAVVGYVYTYTPNAGTPAVVGNIVWDYISVINGLYGAYFPVRIIIQ